MKNVELEVIKRRVSEEENSESQDMRLTTENVEGSQEMEVAADRRHYLEEENRSRRREDESGNNDNGIVIEGEMNDEEKEMISRIVDLMKKADLQIIKGFKKVDRRKLNDITKKVNCVLKYMYVITDSIRHTNKMIKAAAVYIGEQMGLKRKLVGKKSEPWWKRRIEEDIKRVRKNVNILERYMKNELNNINKYNRLDRKYHLKKKGVNMVIEELKQRLMVKAVKIRRYEEKIKQYKQNRMFKIDQKRVHKEFNRGIKRKSHS